MTKVKDKLIRKHIPWYLVLKDIGDLELSAKFWLMKSERRRKHKKAISDNRLAYYVLKSFYGPRRILQYRITGSFY